MKPQRAFAIVLTLGAVSLLAVLIIVFLESVKNERFSATLYSHQLQARRTALNALQMVKSQIKEASSRSDGVWTSQPGLIRVHQENNQQTVYKLYSSDVGRLVNAGFSPSEDNWMNESVGADFVNLNQPINYRGKEIYPILDPQIYSSGKSLIDGFENTQGGGEGAFEMKVKWIYQLADGSMVNQGQFSKENPPVARFAFWTDDESCKVNVNTASEGVYWDSPRTDSREDVDFSLRIPALNEFQRYPGHPAMTSLSPIFTGRLLGGAFAQTGAEYQNQIYRMIPRVSQGGSLGGTLVPTQPVNIDSDRLYGFSDELLFRYSPSSARRELGELDGNQIKRLPFFITANSRAPEETVFSTPRVTIWPFHVNKSWWTAAEKMIAFCSTLNKNIYYFQRQEPEHSTYDYTNIARNQNLVQYLNRTVEKKPPHLSKPLASSWGADAKQIVTQAFDYIRSCVALQNPIISNSYSKLYVDTGNNYNRATGLVVPIQFNDTKGFGRFPCVTQAGICITSMGGGVGQVPASGYPKRVTSSFLFQLQNTSPGLIPIMIRGVQVRVSGLSSFRLNGNLMFGADSSNWVMFGGGRPAAANDSSPISGWLGLSCFNFQSITDIFWQGSERQNPATAPWLFSQYVTIPDAGVNNNSTFSGGTVRLQIRDRSSATIIQDSSFNFPSTTLSLQHNRTSYSVTPGDPMSLINVDNKILSGAGYLCTFIESASDIVRSVLLSTSSQTRGDSRLLAGVVTTPNSFFVNHSQYNNAAVSLAHDFKTIANWDFNPWTSGAYYPGSTYLGKLTKKQDSYISSSAGGHFYSYRPQVQSNLTEAINSTGLAGDWDGGYGNLGDGPFINKADEPMRSSASQSTVNNFALDGVSRGMHYIKSNQSAGSDEIKTGGQSSTSLWYSPNRQMPSAVMFGSLPTGVKRVQPWQTLLFNPMSASDVESSSQSHAGWGNGVPDHLFLDFFRMPVAEPYAISDPLSTAGKININFEIIPFRHLKRASGIHALLKATRIPNIPDSRMSTYKSGRIQNVSFRSEIDLAETVKSFEERFKSPMGAYRTESEICEVPLYPIGVKYREGHSDLYNWWKDRTITGDNLRERPYVEIYPRVTTRSNVFTIHVWAQTLKKNKNMDPNRWVEDKDLVTGEYRGSYLLERYVNPQNSKLPDFAISSDKRLSDYYQFRVIQSKQIVP